MKHGASRSSMDDAANRATATGDYSKLFEAVDKYQREPWGLYQKPFQVTDNIYYVGNTFVACYLVDTGDGLVLIDTAFNATVAQVVHNINLMGYSVSDVKYIFLSHAHLDHCGGARYLSTLASPDCQIYVGQDDLFILDERRDLLFASDPDQVPRFEAVTYDYDSPMTIGKVTFRFVHTPGHTPGCTTMLVDTSIGGEPVTAAMHGGLGLIGLSHRELQDNGLSESLHLAFYEGLERCKKLKVDVVIPSHNKDYDIISKSEQDDGTHRVFIDPEGWSSTMEYKKEAFKARFPESVNQE